MRFKGFEFIRIISIINSVVYTRYCYCREFLSLFSFIFPSRNEQDRPHAIKSSKENQIPKQTQQYI